MNERMYPALISVSALIFTHMAQAQIPDRETRWAESAMNPDYCTWRAHAVWRHPAIKAEKGEEPPTACFRNDFELPAKVREATLCIRPSFDNGYSVLINGEQVVAPAPAHVDGYRVFDVARFLRAGKNVFIFKGNSHGPGINLVVQGTIYCTDGSIVDFVTDPSWRGGYDLPDGWDDPGTDISTLPTLRHKKHFWGYHTPLNPPYDQPIRVTPRGAEQPVFDGNQPFTLDLRVLNFNTPDKPEVELSYDLFDEFARRVLEGPAEVSLKADGNLDLSGTVKHPGLPRGAYQLRFTLSDDSGRQLYSRIFEIGVAGRIPQREVAGRTFTDGMKLKPVCTIDCTEEPDPDAFLALRGNDVVDTVVRKSRAGSFRTFADNARYSGMGWRYSVERLYVPHLVVVEYPDDAPRSVCIQIYEPTTTFPGGLLFKTAGYQRADAGITSPAEHPVHSGTMQKTHLVYRPKEEHACIFFHNLATEAPAAVSRITVYEILNDLPAVKIADAGDRLIGYHSERGPQTMSNNFYAGPLGNFFSYSMALNNHIEFYRNWYTTWSTIPRSHSTRTRGPSI